VRARSAPTAAGPTPAPTGPASALSSVCSRPTCVTMRVFGLISVAVLLGASLSVGSFVTGPPALAQQAVCPVPPKADWSDAEKWAWDQICRGEVADFGARDRDLDVQSVAGWDATRLISPRFVTDVLEEPYASVISRGGLRLANAFAPDQWDLSSAVVPFQIRCFACRFESGLVADDTELHGALDLDGSSFGSTVELRGASVRDDLDLSNGTTITGPLNADDLSVGGNLFLNDRSTFADISLLGAAITGDLDLEAGTTITGTLTADGLSVGGNAFLRGSSKFNDIRLMNATIAKDLDVSDHTTVTGTIMADRLNVGAIRLDSGSSFKGVSLVGAKIAGDLDASNGTTIAGTFDGDRLSAGGSFLLFKSKFAEVDVSAAEFGRDLDASDHVTLTGPLVADDLGATNVFLGNVSNFTQISLLGAAIKGDLDASDGTTIAGTLDGGRLSAGGVVFLDHSKIASVDMTSAVVRGALELSKIEWTGSKNACDLVLVDTEVGGMGADDATQAPCMDLDGLKIEYWEGPPRSAKWFSNWLSRQESFSPLPYQMIAGLLDRSGRSDAANAVRYAARNRQRELLPLLSVERAREMTLWLFVGYGYRPDRALLWLVVIWSCGFLLYRRRMAYDGRRMSFASAAWFSLHTMVPRDIVPVRQRPRETGWLSVIRLAQSLLATVLLLWLVAWATGIVH
jgi:hypothetical protein